MKKLLTAVLSAVAIAVPFLLLRIRRHKQNNVQYNRKKQKAFGLMYVQPRSLTQVIYKMQWIFRTIKSLHAFKQLVQTKTHLLISIAAVAAVQKSRSMSWKNAGYTNVTNHGGYEDLVKKGLK